MIKKIQNEKEQSTFEKLKSRDSVITLNKLFPSILTIFALCAGVTSIRFALDQKWEFALIAILIAGLLDMLDGRIARLLNAQSKFGAELDSLSDMICFGVAPGLILYLWGLGALGPKGWTIFLIYVVCMALRLARFNSKLDDAQPDWMMNFFTGMPAPAAAAFVLLPVEASLEFGPTFLSKPLFLSIWTLIGSFYMISRAPTFSLKGIKITQKYFMIVMVILGLYGYMLVTDTWITLSISIIIYIITLPISIFRFIRYKNKYSCEDFNDAFDKDFY